MPIDEIRSQTSGLAAEAIARMRNGSVVREADYDGEYGRIRLFQGNELKRNRIK